MGLKETWDSVTNSEVGQTVGGFTSGLWQKTKNKVGDFFGWGIGKAKEAAGLQPDESAWSLINPFKGMGGATGGLVGGAAGIAAAFLTGIMGIPFFGPILGILVGLAGLALGTGSGKAIRNTFFGDKSQNQPGGTGNSNETYAPKSTNDYLPKPNGPRTNRDVVVDLSGKAFGPSAAQPAKSGSREPVHTNTGPSLENE